MIQFLRINAQGLPGMVFERTDGPIVNPGGDDGAHEKGGVRIAEAARLVRKRGSSRLARFTAR